jgi:hypothetical protein
MSKSSFLKLILFLVVVCAVVGIGWKALMPDDSLTIDAGITVDPATMGGKKLVGTEDIDESFSISPDGKWLLYDSIHGSSFKPVYALYNIAEQKRQEIKLSPRALEIAANGHGPLGAACWNAESTQVSISTSSSLFMLDVTMEELQMVVFEDDENDKYRYYDECPNLSRPASLVRAVQHSPREIHIVDAGNPQRILARHKAGILMHLLEIGESFSYSPDGKRVAYLVGGARFFGTPSRGYLLDIKSADVVQPRLLAAPVYEPIRWGSDSNTVYARAESGKELSIYEWKLNVER